MGLSYHFTFKAPGKTRPQTLLKFLKTVEAAAKGMGFNPTVVLDAVFDTPERKEFARRLTTGLELEDERLKGVVLPRAGQLWRHNPETGCCRLIPERGVFLVVTDERECETVFGFLRYPATILDVNGKEIMATRAGDDWTCRNFVDSPDKRYRKIVKCFADAGFVEVEIDEFA